MKWARIACVNAIHLIEIEDIFYKQVINNLEASYAVSLKHLPTI